MMNNLAVIATLCVYSMVSIVSFGGVFMAYTNQSRPQSPSEDFLLRGGSGTSLEKGGEGEAADNKTTPSPKKSKDEGKAKDTKKKKKKRTLEEELTSPDEPLNLDDKKALLVAQLREVESLLEEKSMLWCGRDYTHLVEHCPKPCDEDKMCGTDEDGNPMICFNMIDEAEACTEPGVGVKEPNDPASMWCGETWSHALDQCATPCPEGGGCPGGELCYGGVDCASRLEAAKKKKVQSTTPCLKAAEDESCKNTCFEPVKPNECPLPESLVKKCTNNVNDGELCEADNEGACNTSDQLENCSIDDSNGYSLPISVYRRVACCDDTATASSAKQTHKLPAKIATALEDAGVEVFNVPLDEVVGIVGNIVGEAIEIPTDATDSEIHAEIIAALGKAGIDVPEVA